MSSPVVLKRELPELPDGWELSHLKDLAVTNPETLSGASPQYLTFRYIDLGAAVEGDIQWAMVRQTRFQDAPSRARRCVHRDDVLFGTVRPTVRSHGWIPLDEAGPLVASTGFTVIRARPGRSQGRFLLHAVMSDLTALQAHRMEVGSNYPAIDESDVKALLVPHPHVPEQERVATVLDTLGSAIRRTTERIAKLRDVKQSLMQSLLRFGIGPDGRLRDVQAAPSEFKSSRLGLIPRSWDVQTVGNLFSQRVEHGLPGLPIMALTMEDGLIDRRDTDRRVESALTAEQHKRVHEGDIVYNMMRMWQGVIGRASRDCLVSPAYVVLAPKSGVDTMFALYLFSSLGAVALFRRFSQGIVDDRLRLYVRDLAHISFAVPVEKKEQMRIATRLQAADDAIGAETAVLSKLLAVRIGMSRDLLTGRQRVKASAKVTS